MSNQKLKIAVFFGGCSSEYSISLQSAHSVLKNLDASKYEVYPIGITEGGDCFFYRGDLDLIPCDKWYDESTCTPLFFSASRNGSLLRLVEKDGVVPLEIDLAFPVLHGKNGEDGTLQGLIALSGTPLVGCGVLSSALCMDKDRAHKLAELAGIRVPQSLALKKNYDAADVKAFAESVGYPVFVKPIKQGSSYGITRVGDESELADAIAYAFDFDDEVLLEQNINGFEVGCAVMGNDELVVGEVDEIEISGDFFDFIEKYNLITSAIYVPARVDAELTAALKESAKTLYRALGCRGFARVDMFVTPEREIYFNEINTIPGFTEHSRYPGMMRAAGYDFATVLDKLIAYALEG